MTITQYFFFEKRNRYFSANCGCLATVFRFGFFATHAIQSVMKKIISSLLLVSTLSFTACSSTPEPRTTPVVRFALREDNITSWQEMDDGVAVELNQEGQRRLSSMTRNNLGSEMEIYAGRIFVTSEKISRPLRGQKIYVEIDNDDVRDNVLAMLPRNKKS
ncbi:MAG: hypothetical protein DI586_02030 [Micavibrio aeruginosavorus]|uniref:Uncharacterized protein n=1 Tax=Micavibrio aeruginosavorus TaxID=349221 RepID=A0A2W5HTJ6_9BACT|nr:MAG: hypothetical protein DI586_02030 [Micavibrio aeruginosavorus]